MKPNLSILPEAQREIWPLLSNIPNNFILYGGTAIALQLGHRKSVDFDFFSSQPLDKTVLLKTAEFLKTARMVQPEINTLDCYLELPKGSVKFQFLAGLSTRQGRVEEPLKSEDNGIQIASLRDLFATKLNTIQARAEIKDYVDIDALLLHGLNLSDALGCAKAVYGVTFDPGTSLRALCSFRDGDLSKLPKQIQSRLTKAAIAVNEIPEIQAISNTL